MRTKPSKGKTPVELKRSKQINDSKTRQNQPQSTKNPQTRIPVPQATRIMGRYIAGESIRSIAREEDRDRETVTKIVRSIEMREFVQAQRERFFALAPLALQALEEVLNLAEDGRLARDVLADMGVVPTAKEREAFSYDAVLTARAIELMNRLKAQGVQSGDNDAANGSSSAAKVPNETSATGSTAQSVQNSGPDSTARDQR